MPYHGENKTEIFKTLCQWQDAPYTSFKIVCGDRVSLHVSNVYGWKKVQVLTLQSRKRSAFRYTCLSPRSVKLNFNDGTFSATFDTDAEATRFLGYLESAFVSADDPSAKRRCTSTLTHASSGIQVAREPKQRLSNRVGANSDPVPKRCGPPEGGRIGSVQDRGIKNSHTVYGSEMVAPYQKNTRGWENMTGASSQGGFQFSGKAEIAPGTPGAGERSAHSRMEKVQGTPTPEKVQWKMAHDVENCHRNANNAQTLTKAVEHNSLPIKHRTSRGEFGTQPTPDPRFAPPPDRTLLNPPPIAAKVDSRVQEKIDIAVPKNRLMRHRHYGSLQNAGNTCYVNAGVQALRSLAEFIEVLEDNPPDIPVRIYDEMLNTIKKLNHGPRYPVDPNGLRYAVAAEKQHLDYFLEEEQQDAHEFFNELIDRLHDDMKTCSTSKAVSPTEECMTALIDAHFCCTSCDYKRTRKEQYRNLSLALPKSIQKGGWPNSIHELWNSFFRPEVLEYSCEKCKGKKSTVGRSMTRYPPVLSLQLKRFHAHYDASRRKMSCAKVATPVNIPDFLDLDGQCYELRSVVCHQGPLPDYGHYTCWVRNADYARPLWTLYDDACIHTSNTFPEDITTLAYMVFYVKRRNLSTGYP